MYIKPSSCFSDSSKTMKDPAKPGSPETRSMEKLIVDNPLMFRILCCCVVRQRKRVDTAKLNGHSVQLNNNDTVETTLSIDHIEFTPTDDDEA